MSFQTNRMFKREELTKELSERNQSSRFRVNFSSKATKFWKKTLILQTTTVGIQKRELENRDESIFVSKILGFLDCKHFVILLQG